MSFDRLQKGALFSLPNMKTIVAPDRSNLKQQALLLLLPFDHVLSESKAANTTISTYLRVYTGCSTVICFSAHIVTQQTAARTLGELSHAMPDTPKSCHA